MSVYVIIPFHSSDYGKWKEIFDEFASARDAWGAEGYVVYRGLDDPNSVAVVHYFADREGAERFVNDPSIRAAIAYWNAPQIPDIHVYEEVPPLTPPSATILQPKCVVVDETRQGATGLGFTRAGTRRLGSLGVSRE
jgi:quinol monooxygenase YgiN